jgi:hypothetical protein
MAFILFFIINVLSEELNDKDLDVFAAGVTRTTAMLQMPASYGDMRVYRISSNSVGLRRGKIRDRGGFD